MLAAHTMRLLDIFARPLIAIDAGTATTRICARSSAILEHDSCVHEEIGSSALRRSAMRAGVVCDIAAAAQVLEPLVARLRPRWRRPEALVCAPSDALREEREALIEAVTEAGATVVRVVSEPLAAAIGSGVDVASEQAQMIADIGEGVTDVAVIRSGAVVHSAAMRSGCGEIRRTFTEWLEWHHGLVVDDERANAVIIDFCAGVRRSRFEIRGVIDGRTTTLTFHRDHLEAVIEPSLDAIAFFISSLFRRLPDKAAAEIIESGLRLAGGGAKLDLLVDRIERATHLTVTRPHDPLHSVISGAQAMLASGVVVDESLV